MRYSRLKLLARTKGVLFFLTLIIIPLSGSISIIKFLEKGFELVNAPALSKIISDSIFAMIFQFLIFLSAFLFIKIKCPRNAGFITGENWFVSMGKAFAPAIMAFSLGLLATFFTTTLFGFLPQSDYLKKWLYTPNYGFEMMFDYIKNYDHLKVVTLFLFIVVLAPIYEEIVFRGFLQESAGRYFRKYNFDIIIVSLIFSLFHISSLSNTVFAFTVGLILSGIRKKTGKINTTIWVHSIINFTGLVSGLIYYYLKMRM